MATNGTFNRTIEELKHAVPGFGNEGGFWLKGDNAFHATDEGAQLARLIWLEYWVRYALENCDKPALYNF